MWVSIKRSKIVYIYSNKGRRNLGFTAIPPLSASRTKTRRGNLAGESAKACAHAMSVSGQI